MTSSILKESKLLARHSTIYALGNFMNKIAAFLLLPVYTQYLTPNDYGMNELVGLSTDVIGVLLSTAISSAIYRFYFEYTDTKDRNVVVSSAIISIGCISLAAVLLLYFATRTMAQYILDSRDLYYYFIISFTSLWFQSMNNISNDYLRANQMSTKFISLSFLKLIIVISLNIYLICFLRIGVLGILISTLAGSVVLFLVLTVPLLFQIGFRFSYDKIREMIRFGLPLIPSQLGAFVVNLSDRFFIKGYCSIADAGLYSLGYRFGALPSTFISEPFNQTWLPRRFELYKQEGSEILFGKIFTYFLCLMIFAGLVVSVLTKDILMIIADEKFWSAYKIVPIITVAIIVFTLHYHFNMGILIQKKTKYFAYINFSNAGLIIILNFLLIPRYGVYGAAIATLLAFVYKVAFTYYLSSKYYKIHFEFIRISKVLLAAAIVYGLTLPISSDSLLISFVLKGLIICLFPFVLYSLNFLTRFEKDWAMAFIRQRCSN